MASPILSEQAFTIVLGDIMLFFGIAGLIVPLLQRLKISSILGYLLCGIMIGPFGLAALSNGYPWLSAFTITDTRTVHMLGELGIITLMFMIGLELSLERLQKLKRLIFGLGSAQVLITSVAIIAIAFFFGNTFEASILIGVSFSLSSTAIVMKLLEERHLSNRPIGIICFSILLMQDLAVIPVLVLASSFSSGGGFEALGLNLAYALAIGAITVALMIFIGRKILTPLLHSISFSRNAEWLAAFTVFIVIGCAIATQNAGLSLALGAFLAGLLIAETEFRHEVGIIVLPLKGILLGIFFLSVGMMINIEEILRQPVLLLLSVIGIFAIKAAILFPLCLAFKIPPKQSAEASFYMAQPGEFALLILGVATASSLMPPQDIQFFLLVVALSMMASPLLFKATPFIVRWGGRFFEKSYPAEQDILHMDQRLILIAGFGRIGALLAHVLEDQKIAYIGFDNDAARVMDLKRKGYRVIYGDARKIELWNKLYSNNVAAAIIAIDDHTAARAILRSLHAQWPLLPVIVRAKDTNDMNALYDMGAKFVVAETLESSLSVARYVIEALNPGKAEAEKIMARMRDQLFMPHTSDTL